MSYSSKIKEKSASKNTELEEMKERVRNSFEYAQENNDRFRYFMNFICNTSLDDTARGKLKTINKSPLEFNEIEAYVSRQLGEFSKQQPSLDVRASNSVGAQNMTKDLLDTISVVENFIRYLMSDQNTDSMSEMIYDDMLKGGFSVLRMYTDYEHPMSSKQEIYLEKEMYPTMCFWDPLAVKSHKGDGEYCGRIIVYPEDEAIRLFGNEVTKDCSYNAYFQDFAWSYSENNRKFIAICEYYKKKMKKVKIVDLSNGITITKKEYEELLTLWDDAGYIEQPPIIIEERYTHIPVICRYILSENRIISYEETIFKFFPLIFFDGNSAIIENKGGANKKTMTRPYPYHLRDVQILKNVAGQGMAYEIENTIAHKLIMESNTIDMTQMEQLRNFQIADIIVWNSRREGDNEALPGPREVVRPDIPQIIPHTFTETSRTMQSILGSYDAQLGLQRSNLSGDAIDSGSVSSANAAYPYLRGYIRGLNQLGLCLLDLIPKIYNTPRTIPVIAKDGKRTYQVINDESHPESVFMNYDPNMLNITIEAGVNAEVQKKVALNQLISMCKASQVFAQFMNEEGLEIFLDNLDIRGIDNLKEKAGGFMQQLKQRQAMMESKPNPEQMKMQLEEQKIRQKDKEIELKGVEIAGKMQNEDRKISMQFVETLSKVRNEQMATAAKIQQSESEDVRSEALLAIQLSKHESDIQKDKRDRVERVLMHQDLHSLEKKKHSEKMEIERRKIDGESNENLKHEEE